MAHVAPATCAAVPTSVEGVAEAVVAGGVAAPVLCNLLANDEAVLAVGAVGVEVTVLGVGDRGRLWLALPVAPTYW